MRASVSKNDSCVCVCVRERESVCVIVVDFGKKKETNLSARQKKMYTSAEELDTNTVIVVELGNEPFLFVKVL